MRIDSLIVLSLSSLIACGAAQEPSTTPSSKTPAPAACDAGADIVFQIDRKSIDRAPDDPVSSVVVRSSGAWTSGANRGCLVSADLTALRTVLDGAPWQATVPDAVCEIQILVRTEYRVGGRHVWTAQGCASDLLDDHSKRALDAALAVVRRSVPLAE